MNAIQWVKDNNKEEPQFNSKLPGKPHYWIESLQVRMMGNLTLDGLQDEVLPVNFGPILGNVVIRNCPNLRSLSGISKKIGGSLTLENLPNLPSFEDGPVEVGRYKGVLCDSAKGERYNLGSDLALKNLPAISLSGFPKYVEGKIDIIGIPNLYTGLLTPEMQKKIVVQKQKAPSVEEALDMAYKDVKRGKSTPSRSREYEDDSYRDYVID